MGRFSPTVLPQPSNALAVGISSLAGGFQQSRQQRRRERLQAAREKRQQELLELRRRSSDIDAARRGFLPEDAAIPEADFGSSPARGGGRSQSERALSDFELRDGLPPPNNELANALAGLRGETDRQPFIPGDVRQLRGLTRRRIELPSGGSILETPPDVRREQERENELARTLTEGFEAGGRVDPRTRADAFVQTGQDVFAPSPRPIVPTAAQLEAAGATQKEIRAVEGDPEAARDLRDELVGRRTSPGEPDIEETPAFNQAVRTFQSDPSADPDEVSSQTGIPFAQVLEARDLAIRSEERTPGAQSIEGVERQIGTRPFNNLEEQLFEKIAELGSVNELRRRINKAIDLVARNEPDLEKRNRRVRELSDVRDALRTIIRRSNLPLPGEEETGPRTLAEVLGEQVSSEQRSF